MRVRRLPALRAHLLESLPGEKGSSLTGSGRADVSRAGWVTADGNEGLVMEMEIRHQLWQVKGLLCCLIAQVQWV